MPNKDWNQILKEASTPFTVLIDEVVEGEELYFGYAYPGNDDPTQSVWRIKKMVKVGTVFKFKFADGTEEFIKVWDDRASYTY